MLTYQSYQLDLSVSNTFQFIVSNDRTYNALLKHFFLKQ